MLWTRHSDVQIHETLVFSQQILYRMSLAQERTKKKIGQDPNNKAWSENKDRLGYKLLQKMGWSEGMGLGAKMDGATKHVELTACKENLGIGASVDYENKWIEQTSSFDNLLKRLNEDAPSEEAKLKTKKHKRKSKSAKLQTGSDSTSPDDRQPEDQTKNPIATESIRLAHRQKFLKNKSVKSYSEEDFKAIFGDKL